MIEKLKRYLKAAKRPDSAAKTIAAEAVEYSDTAEEIIDGAAHGEALKITACADVTIANKTLIGGWEDCLDAVRVGHLHVRDCRMVCSPDSRTFVTAKGGGVEHVFEDIVLAGNPRWWSFSFGDWTLYNANPAMPPMRKVVLRRVHREDGKRFVVLQLYCDKVVVEDSRAIVINLRWIAPAWFWLLRKVRRRDPRAIEQVPKWIT